MTDNEMILETFYVKPCVHGFAIISDCRECMNGMFNIVERAAKISCCLCRDSCLSCDATELLREMGIDK